jgi:hypothetical protein
MRPVLFVAAMIGAMPVLAATDAIARVPMCAAAGPGNPAGPGRRIQVPLPDAALLAPPPQFDCTFKVGDEPPPNPPSAQGDPGTDAALRKKLDYERQCYRHAEMILRDRLLLLQGPAGDTVKAAAKCVPASASARTGAKPAIPLPDRALLAPPPEFACEFKGEAGADARKLDYERQCYRHAEMILRDRLVGLQASLGETITAVSRSGQPAVTRARPASTDGSRSEQPAIEQPRSGTVSPSGQAALVQPRLGDQSLAKALQAGGYVIVHRYIARMPSSSPPAMAETIDSGQRVTPQGRVSARAMGAVYRRLGIPVSQVLSSEHFVVYQTATAAFGNRVGLHRDLSGSRSFSDPEELERSLSGLRARVATPPAAGTNVVLWTHEGKFKKAFGRPLPAGATVVFDPRGGRVPREVGRLSLREFLALAE